MGLATRAQVQFYMVIGQHLERLKWEASHFKSFKSVITENLV